MRRLNAFLIGGLATLACAAAPDGARAESGYLPFYGWAEYFGRPATYYSADNDVQQTTRPVEGLLGFGVRSYSAGGPFWYYKPTHPTAYRPARRRHAVIRRKG